MLCSELEGQWDHSIIVADPFILSDLLKAVPAKGVVYLLCDRNDNPVQLLCVGNLRASLKRRFGDEEAGTPTRRVDYRGLIRRIHWIRVDSAFEADAVYLEVARRVFPDSYAGIIGFRPPWFVHVNPNAEFPRFTKTNEVGRRGGVYLGPIEDKHAAGRLVELVESCFDLCRYYNVLTESPHGRPCAYKEMGKCPAPCDGSISLPQYRRLVEWAIRVLSDPADYIREQTGRMSQAAAELRFEIASRIKGYVDELSALGRGPYRYLAPSSDFRYLCIQPGPRTKTAKIFLIGPGSIELIACVIGTAPSSVEILRLALERSAESSTSIDGPGVERVGVVAHHLFLPKAFASRLLQLAQVDETAITKALKEVQKQPTAESDDEGAVRELQAI